MDDKGKQRRLNIDQGSDVSISITFDRDFCNSKANCFCATPYLRSGNGISIQRARSSRVASSQSPAASLAPYAAPMSILRLENFF